MQYALQLVIYMYQINKTQKVRLTSSSFLFTLFRGFRSDSLLEFVFTIWEFTKENIICNIFMSQMHMLTHRYKSI